MIIYPAIDIKQGQAVRLRQGRADEATVYFADPLEPARKWKAAGSEWVHVVDLDGAFTGEPANRDIIAKIADLGLNVQMGGGLRTEEDVESALNAGVSRVVIGTRAVRAPEFVAQMVDRFEDRVAVGIDARNGKVAIKGWVDTTDADALQLARDMAAAGVQTIIYTDISRDGALTGPNFEAQQRMAESVSCQIIASGGVSEPADIERFREIEKTTPNLSGVIIGKALYEERIDLASILQS